MICPLYSTANIDGRDFTVKITCHKAQCAWYDERRKQCAVLTMAKALSNINGGVAK